MLGCLAVASVLFINPDSVTQTDLRDHSYRAWWVRSCEV